MVRSVSSLSRRGFLAAAATAAVSPLVLPSTLLGREGAVPPSEQLVMALIGYGNRGSEIIGGFLGDRNNFRVVAVCDCDEKHLKAGKSRVDSTYANSDCQSYSRYEDVLDRKDIDVVAVATPDHWHTKITVEACKAGKDVYCEKPLTLCPIESRQIVAAARKYNRVCTSGSQRVMEDYGYMAPIVQSGALGEVKEAFLQVGGPPQDCYLPEEPIPAGFDWDRWLGPAPLAPFNADRCSGSYGGGWRRFWDYGNGFLADWGAH
ncbi:MAG: Gfo/Idh/MocA family oxidoreductase, partial [Planctomycetaceae bacterium]|nr:Gfo/Idh/MocA family oxidoreductase [Planctomycetaceae bacterium]